jgi:hypothetical protein
MMRSWLMRTVALVGICLGMSWLSAATFGQMQTDQSRLHPCIKSCCPPNIPYAGYYQTTWRQWPGEQDIGQFNPRGAVAEPIQTPQGFEQLPTPKAVPQQPQQQPQPQPTPASPLLLPGTIRSPGGLLSPRDIPSEPDVKSNAKPETKSETTPKPKSETPPTPTGSGLPVPGPLQSSPANSNPDPGPNPKTSAAQHPEKGGIVSLASNVEPDRGVPARGDYRADPIAAATPSAALAKVDPTGYAEAASPAKLMKPEVVATDTVVDAVPAAMPAVALGGYCPVELLSHGRWVQGDVRWTVVYDGHIYRLSGPEQRTQFLAASAVFAPVNSGNDTVLLINENRTVSGLPAYCAVYNGRLFMFSSLATQAEFNNNPQRYVPAR